MEKEAIVRKLLSLGVMTTPETLKKIEEIGLDAFLEKISKSQGAVFHEEEKSRDRLSCCIAGPVERPEMTPDDVIKANAEKFRKISGLLLRKMDAVSIKNIGRTSAKLSIVGMVKDKTGQGFVLEDETGEIEVISNEKVELDDVIGVRGWLREKALFAQETVYPDIQIDRAVNSMDNTLLLLGESASKNREADMVLTPAFFRDAGGKEKAIQNPAWIFLEKGSKKMAIVVYRPEEKTGRDDVMAWLKKRYIGSGRAPAPEKSRIIETVPDIFWIVSANEPWTTNYKGITLVSFDNGNQASIDLRTRKIEFVQDKPIR